MKSMKRTLSIMMLIFAAFFTVPIYADTLATVKITASKVQWVPVANFGGLSLRVSTPSGFISENTYPQGMSPQFTLSSSTGNTPDGSYTWELTALPSSLFVRGDNDVEQGEGALVGSVMQSGAFSVIGGVVVNPDNVEGATGGVPKDVVNADDTIVQGNLCVGLDCINGESFALDTVRLKANNTRIKFEDTSSTVGFPSTDWQLTANDSSGGGLEKFSIEDTTSATVPFTIAGAAPSNSLFVNSSGFVGLGTSTPLLKLHQVKSDTPAIRLEQDGSGGFTPHTWDIAGNEANFFVRDVTGGSKLPFRIFPGAPTDSLRVESDGKVNMNAGNLNVSAGFIAVGHTAPVRDLDIRTADRDAKISVIRKDALVDVSMVLIAGNNVGKVGTTNDKRLMMIVNDIPRMVLQTNNSITTATGASLSTGGVWTNASSRDLKENIEALDTEEAYETLSEMNPVKYNYKSEKDENHVGFIAEDVPSLVATKDRKGMSPMDVTAVLTKVVQDQQNTIAELKARLEQMEALVLSSADASKRP